MQAVPMPSVGTVCQVTNGERSWTGLLHWQSDKGALLICPDPVQGFITRGPFQASQLSTVLPDGRPVQLPQATLDILRVFQGKEIFFDKYVAPLDVVRGDELRDVPSSRQCPPPSDSPVQPCSSRRLFQFRAPGDEGDRPVLCGAVKNVVLAYMLAQAAWWAQRGLKPALSPEEMCQVMTWLWKQHIVTAEEISDIGLTCSGLLYDQPKLREPLERAWQGLMAEAKNALMAGKTRQRRSFKSAAPAASPAAGMATAGGSAHSGSSSMALGSASTATVAPAGSSGGSSSSTVLQLPPAPLSSVSAHAAPGGMQLSLGGGNVGLSSSRSSSNTYAHHTPVVPGGSSAATFPIATEGINPGTWGDAGGTISSSNTFGGGNTGAPAAVFGHGSLLAAPVSTGGGNPATWDGAAVGYSSNYNSSSHNHSSPVSVPLPSGLGAGSVEPMRISLSNWDATDLQAQQQQQQQQQQQFPVSTGLLGSNPATWANAAGSNSTCSTPAAAVFGAHSVAAPSSTWDAASSAAALSTGAGYCWPGGSGGGGTSMAARSGFVFDSHSGGQFPAVQSPAPLAQRAQHPAHSAEAQALAQRCRTCVEQIRGVLPGLQGYVVELEAHLPTGAEQKKLLNMQKKVVQALTGAVSSWEGTFGGLIQQLESSSWLPWLNNLVLSAAAARYSALTAHRILDRITGANNEAAAAQEQQLQQHLQQRLQQQQQQHYGLGSISAQVGTFFPGVSVYSTQAQTSHDYNKLMITWSTTLSAVLRHLSSHDVPVPSEDYDGVYGHLSECEEQLVELDKYRDEVAAAVWPYVQYHGVLAMTTGLPILKR